MNEQEIWRAFQRGDEQAYTQLYQHHVRAMYRYGMSLVPASEAFVLDCVHDVFTELWAKRARLTTPDNARFYLLKSLKIRIVSLLERKERPSRALSDKEFDELWAEPDELEVREELEAASSRQERLRLLIEQLPPRQQEALKLRFVESMDYTQIGEVLAINQQSAKNLVFRAVEKLRDWIVILFILFSTFFCV